jgi:predicted nucleic acid-binding protein
MIVVADTSPILYLLLLNQLNLLPQLYRRILIPSTVRDEMFASGAPIALQHWISNPPEWLEIRAVELADDLNLMRLDPGERAAIQLAQQINADLLIVDDKAGRQAALRLGLRITGLLGVLGEAAALNLIDLPIVLDQLLRETNFRASPRLVQFLLNKHNSSS